jgi:hypothetical protein
MLVLAIEFSRSKRERAEALPENGTEEDRTNRGSRGEAEACDRRGARKGRIASDRLGVRHAFGDDSP